MKVTVRGITFVVALLVAASSGLQAGATSGAGAGDDPGEHGSTDGHLPPSVHNMKLLARLRLTDVANGVSDVAAKGGYAYVGAFATECAVRGGGGVHVVDIGDPRNPKAVGFIDARPNTYVGEGVFVFHMDTAYWRGNVLLHSNESCGFGHTGGISLWDVRNPRRPRPLSQGAGDRDPNDGSGPKEIASTVHSAMSWQQGRRAFAVLTDTQEEELDVDILDITNPFRPRLIAETGVIEWPEVDIEGRGAVVNHHDMWVRRVDHEWLLLLSYWDAGWIVLNVDDPANPRFVAHSRYPRPDSLTGFDPPEGNAHQATWTRGNRFILATDEDVSSTRTDVGVAVPGSTDVLPASTLRGARSVADVYGERVDGPVAYGGSGCTADTNSDGRSDRNEIPPATEPPAGEASIVLVVRGSCPYSEKMESARQAGYDVVIVAADHSASDSGRHPDAFDCGDATQAADVAGVCTGHRAAHLLLNDSVEYHDGPVADDLAGSSGRAVIQTSDHFDGWGHLRLLDAGTLRERAAYAIPEALDPAYRSGAGELSIHEIKIDPRRGINLAYASWYAGGARVIRYGAGRLSEAGHFIAPGGSDLWGTFPIARGSRRPVLLFSDRDFGLYILRYTGKET